MLDRENSAIEVEANAVGEIGTHDGAPVQIAQATSELPELPDAAKGARVGVEGGEENAADAPRTRFVADASNTVQLPDGLELDNVLAEGRDLILVQADGTRIVIEGGALNVPTFVIGEVTIPQQVLIAALQENGLNIAAGPDGTVSVVTTSSSGGNLSDGQGSIGDAGEVIDLLGDTTFGFDAPTFDALDAAVNLAPEFADFEAGAVSEEGFEIGLKDSDSKDDEIFGTFPATDPEGGVLTFAFGIPTTPLTSDNKIIEWAIDEDGVLFGYTETDGGRIDIIRAEISGNGYKITLLGQIDHPDKTTEDVLDLVIPVIATDVGGLSTTANMTVRIEDDSPEAKDDGQLGQIQESGSAVVIGSIGLILNNDGFGGDGAAKVQPIVIEKGDLGGTVTIADGQLIYTPGKNVGPGGEIEKFFYTITDRDGDTSSASFTLKIVDSEVTELKVSAANLIADEDNLPNGIVGGNGDIDPIVTGSISYNLGIDKIGSVTLSTAYNATTLTTLAGTPVVTFWDPASKTLVGYVQGTDGTLVGNQVFKIEVTDVTDSGAKYTLTLLQPVKHSGEAPGFEETSLPFDVTVTVTDSDGSVGTTSFSVAVNDDVPEVFANEAQTQDIDIAYTIQAGNVLYRGLQGAGDFDLLLTARSGSSAASVNTTNSDAAVANGWIDTGANETLRIDLMKGLVTSSNPSPGYTAEGRFGVDEFRFSVPQVQGGPSNTATIFIQLFAVADNDDLTSTGADFSSVSVVGVSGVLVNGAPIASGNLTPVVNGGGVTIGYTISGIKEGDVITIQGAGDFGRIEISNPAGGKDFSIGGLGTTVTVPVAFEVRHDETKGVNTAADPYAADDTDEALPPALADKIGEMPVLGKAVTVGDVSGLFTYNAGADGLQSLSYGLTTKTGGLFTGEPTGLTTTVGGHDIALYSDGAVVWGVADGDLSSGTKVFAAYIDASGKLWLVQFQAIAHNVDGSTQDAYDDVASVLADVRVTLTIVDRDGDPATATSNTPVKLSFQDDGPTITADTTKELTISVDETMLGTPAAQSFAGVFTTNYGTDGKGSLTYSLGFKAGDTGLIDTASGKPVVLSLENGLVVGKADGQVVFTVSVNDDGLVTLQQLRPVKHPTNDPNEPVSLSADDLITLTATAKDGDGDTKSASVGIGKNLVFLDDGPSISVASDSVILSVDESYLSINAKQSFAGAFTSQYGADGAGSIAYTLGINSGATGLVDTQTGATVVLSMDGQTVIGTAGAGGPIVFKVSVDASGNVTLDQQRAISHPNQNDPNDTRTLAQDNLITLTATITDRDGDLQSAALNIGQNLVFKDDGPSISTKLGTIFLVVDESNLNVDASADFSRAFHASFGADGAGTITYALGINPYLANLTGLVDTASGKLVVLSLENGEVVGRAGTGGEIVFKVTVDESGVVTLDQQRALKHENSFDHNDVVFLSLDKLVTLKATIVDGDGDKDSATLEIGHNLLFKDDGPSISATNDTITLTVDETTLVTNDTKSFAGAFTTSFGEDGPGSISYSLSIKEMYALTGLIDTQSGQQVKLMMNNGVVEGRTVSGHVLVFTVKVDSAGNVTLDQIRAVKHADGSNPDETRTLSADDLVKLTATITDGDGDKASATLNIGQNLNFKDDGPSISVKSDNITLTVDETTLATNDTKSFAGAFTTSFGEDGQGSISYSLGIKSPGALTGLVDTASNQDVKLVMNGGVVEGRTVTGNQLVFTITVSGNGNVTLDQIRAVKHADASNPNETRTLSADDLVKLTATITDGDGDTASATLNIGQNLNFKDDGPSISVKSDNITLTVDETTLATNDTKSFAGAFTTSFGEDGQGSISYSLGIKSPGALTGLVDTASNQDVKLVMNGGVVEGRTVTGNQLVFTITVSGNGNVTLDQIRAVKHADASNPNETRTLSADDLVKLTATITDGDGDTASATLNIGQNLNFKDDGPSISATNDTITLTVDETTLVTNDTKSFAGAFTTSFGEDGPGSISYSLSIKEMYALTGLIDTQSGQQVKLMMNNGVVEGRTVSGHVLVFTVKVDSAGNVTLDQIRAVKHADGSNPDETRTLSADDLVKLTATITDGDGDKASATLNIGQNLNFKDDGPSISVKSDNITLTVDETTLATNDTKSFAGAFTTSFGEDGQGSISYSLGIKSPGALTGLVDTASNQDVKLVMNGGVVEGRTVTGNQLVFTITVSGNGNVTLDQIRAVKHADASNPNETRTLSADDLVKLTATITDGDGDTASATLNIGQNLNFKDDGPSISVKSDNITLTVDETTLATNDTKSFAGAFTTSFGEDGQGSISYSLGIKAAGELTGLVDTASNQDVKLVMNNGVVEGRTVTGDELVFTITVGANGDVTLDQIRAVKHADGSNPDETRTLSADDLVKLTATITDGDGDSASATLNIGQNLNFKDDGPSISATNDTITLTVDETTLATNDTKSFAGAFTTSFGEDGQGSISYSLGIKAAGELTGLVDTASNQDVKLVMNNGVVEGRTVTGDELVFTITVSANGDVTLDQIRAVKHADASDPNESRTLSADDLVKLTATITDGDGDTASATLNIGQNLNFKDDGPEAVAGDALVVAETAGATAGENLLANDKLGADGATVTHVSFDGGTTWQAIGSGPFIVNGVGTFTFAANGAWSLDPVVNVSAANQTGSFLYKITDGDGDTSQASQSFTVENVNTAPTASSVTIRISEEGLPTGKPDTAAGTGAQDTTNSTTASQSLNAQDAENNPLTFTFTSAPTGLKSGTLDIAWTGIGTSQLVGKVGATTIITLSINSAGLVTAALSGPLDHATGLGENELQFQVDIEVSDSQLSTTTSATIVVEDDSTFMGAFTSAITPNQVGTVTGNFEIVPGGDGVGSFGITGPTISGVTYLPVVTSTDSNGVTVSTLTATSTSTGATIFTLSVYEDGSYTFNLVAPSTATTQDIVLSGLPAAGPQGFRETADGRVEFTGIGGSINSNTNGLGIGNQFIGQGQGVIMEFHSVGSPGPNLPNENPEYFDKISLVVVTGSGVYRWTTFNENNGTVQSGLITITGAGTYAIPTTLQFSQFQIVGTSVSGQGIQLATASMGKTILPTDQALNFSITAVDGDGDVTTASLLSVNVIAGTTLTGTAANEVFGTRTTADTINGGGGHDIVDYSDSSSAVLINLRDDGSASGTLFGVSTNGYISGGDATGDILSNIEGIRGSNHNDILYGNSSANTLIGGGGSDQLYGEGGDDYLDGGAGNDFLFGGDGDDILIGGLGIDELTGGTGKDTFVFTGLDARDVILDFNHTDDTIDLTALLNGLAPDTDLGALGYVKITQQGTDALLQVDIDGTAGSAHSWVDVALLQGFDSTAHAVKILFQDTSHEVKSDQV